jgi:hypothetical protein
MHRIDRVEQKSTLTLLFYRTPFFRRHKSLWSKPRNGRSYCGGNGTGDYLLLAAAVYYNVLAERLRRELRDESAPPILLPPLQAA